MVSTVSDFFSQRIFGKQLLHSFENMARTITNEYVQDIYNSIEINGYTPSFEELMEKVKALDNDLKMRAFWIREDYREGRGRRSIKLTTGCKRVINQSVNDYLVRSKTILAIRKQQRVA